MNMIISPTRDDLREYFDTWMRMLYFYETVEGFFSRDDWFRQICHECIMASTDLDGRVWMQYYIEIFYVLVAQYDFQLFRVLVDVGYLYQD